MASRSTYEAMFANFLSATLYFAAIGALTAFAAYMLLFCEVQERQRVARHHRSRQHTVPFLGGGERWQAGVVAQGVTACLDRAR